MKQKFASLKRLIELTFSQTDQEKGKVNITNIKQSER